MASLTSAPELVDGTVIWGDAPSFRAAKNGRVLVIDECDKAPSEVVAVLKLLVREFRSIPIFFARARTDDD